jgi:hypothetical protein
MKKLVFVAFMCVMSAGVLLAQTSGIEKSKKINKDEVPVTVQTTFQENFSISPDEGTWFLQFVKYAEGNLVTFKPVAYIFKKKNGKEKVEIRFSPSGALEQAKGIEKKTATESSGS